jgi:hypothetical protein
MPTTFPNQNNHRLVVYQPDLDRPDFERLEDIGADAIAAARSALETTGRLPHALFKPVERQLAALTEAVDRRRVLSEDYRCALADMLRALAKVEVGDDEAEIHDQVSRALRDALNLSHRVADLLAAEKDIGWQRGFRG